ERALRGNGIADVRRDAARIVGAAGRRQDQRGELGRGLLVARRIRVGDVVGNRAQAVGPRIHAGNTRSHRTVEAQVISPFVSYRDARGRALREAGCRVRLPPAGNLLSTRPVDAVAKEALGIDRVETELLAQLLAQLGDVAFDDVLFDVLVEDAVDRVEDLGLGEPAAAVGDQIFQDAALAARQG